MDVGFNLDLQAQIVFTIFFSGLFTLLALLWLYRAWKAISTVREKSNAGRGDVEVFARIFSHYVKNELLVMRGLAIKAREEGNPEKRSQTLSEIEKTIEEMYSHTNRLHDLMSVRKVVFKRLTVDDWVDKAMAVFLQQCPDAVVQKDVRYHGFITIDSLLLGEVLVNLLKNSYEAIELFRLSEAEIPEEIRLSVFYMDGWLFVQVMDHGIGMDPEQIKKAFRPFFSTKKAKTNWGIGLYTCRKVVQLHRGYIEIVSNTQSTPRRTTATLAIPMIKQGE